MGRGGWSAQRTLRGCRVPCPRLRGYGTREPEGLVSFPDDRRGGVAREDRPTPALAARARSLEPDLRHPRAPLLRLVSHRRLPPAADDPAIAGGGVAADAVLEAEDL